MNGIVALHAHESERSQVKAINRRLREDDDHVVLAAAITKGLVSCVVVDRRYAYFDGTKRVLLGAGSCSSSPDDADHVLVESSERPGVYVAKTDSSVSRQLAVLLTRLRKNQEPSAVSVVADAYRLGGVLVSYDERHRLPKDAAKATTLLIRLGAPPAPNIRVDSLRPNAHGFALCVNDDRGWAEYVVDDGTEDVTDGTGTSCP